MTEQTTDYEMNPKNDRFDPFKDYWPKYGTFRAGFKDYTNDLRLTQFKETLPSSIQRIIEFEHSLRIHETVIELDFHEIERDLKYQYDKLNGNKIELQQMFFFCFNSHRSHTHSTVDGKISNCCDKRYRMLFYGNGRHESKNYTVVHYLLNKIYTLLEVSSDPNGNIIIQLLKMLKLLITNNIIHCADNFGDGNTIWSRLTWSIYGLDRSQFVPENVKDEFIDLIMICQPQNALMNIEVNISYYDIKYIKSQQIKQRRSIPYISNAVQMNIIDFAQINKRCQLIEGLLFRTIVPFKFIEPTLSSDVRHSLRTHSIIWSFCNNAYNKNDDLIFNDSNSFKDLNLNQNFIMDFLKKETNYKTHCECQMILLAPLIFIPYLKVAKDNMKSLLTKCMLNYQYVENDTLSNLISTIISHYLFVDYNHFYDMNILDNMNVKSLLFLNYLKYTHSTNHIFMEFKDKYCNNKMIHFLVDNDIYRKLFVDNIARHNVDFVVNIIKEYNNDYKFPLENNGFDELLQWMFYYVGGYAQGFYKLIQFIKYIKNVYAVSDDTSIKINFSSDNEEQLSYIAMNKFQNDPSKQMEIINVLTKICNLGWSFVAQLLRGSVMHENLNLFQYLIQNSEYCSFYEVRTEVRNLVLNGVDDLRYKTKEETKQTILFFNSLKELLCLEFKDKQNEIEKWFGSLKEYEEKDIWRNKRKKRKIDYFQ